MFAHTPEVAAFWIDLAHDEEHHADALKETQESLTNEQLTQSADPQLLINIKEILTTLKEIQLDQINTLDDAYKVAHELEISEINSVFKILAAEYISEKNRMETTISQLGDHIEKLMTFNEHFGNKTWREGIIARHLVPQK